MRFIILPLCNEEKQRQEDKEKEEERESKDLDRYFCLSPDHEPMEDGAHSFYSPSFVLLVHPKIGSTNGSLYSPLHQAWCL